MFQFLPATILFSHFKILSSIQKAKENDL